MKAFEMKLKHFPTDHCQLAITYSNIEMTCDDQWNYTAAVENHQKFLDSSLKSSIINQDELS
jgi:hypothetical protein